MAGRLEIVDLDRSDTKRTHRCRRHQDASLDVDGFPAARLDVIVSAGCITVAAHLHFRHRGCPTARAGPEVTVLVLLDRGQRRRIYLQRACGPVQWWAERTVFIETIKVA